MLGFSAVAAGALASHLSASALSPVHRAMMREAVQVQGWHSAALLACGLLAERVRSRPAATGLLAVAALGFAVGTVLFVGGVDALALGGDRSWAIFLGHAAPVGGIILMLAWLLLAGSVLFRRAGPA